MLTSTLQKPGSPKDLIVIHLLKKFNYYKSLCFFSEACILADSSMNTKIPKYTSKGIRRYLESKSALKSSNFCLKNMTRNLQGSIL